MLFNPVIQGHQENRRRLPKCMWCYLAHKIWAESQHRIIQLWQENYRKNCFIVIFSRAKVQHIIGQQHQVANC